MGWLIPNPVVGAMIGFIVGVLSFMSFSAFGLEMPGSLIWILGAVGIMAGGTIGALLSSRSDRSRSMARWCAAMAGIVGGVSFVAGFVGPMIFWPGANQGPLLGIFITGPLGTLAGAILGLLIGLFVPRSSPTRNA